MAIDISFFLEPKIIILSIIALALVIFIVVLFIMQKKLKNRVSLKEIEEQEDVGLKNKILEIRSSNAPPEELLASLDKFARNLFYETFQTQKNMDYSELIHFFKQKEKEEIVSFCQQMIKTLYSGEKISRSTITGLTKSLESLIIKDHPNIKNITKVIELNKETVETNMTSNPKLATKAKTEEVYEKEEKIDPALKLARIDEEQIRNAYKELQRRFRQAYSIAEKLNNKTNLAKLEAFRAEIERIVEGFSKDHIKIIDLAQDISKGSKLLNEVGSF